MGFAAAILLMNPTRSTQLLTLAEPRMHFRMLLGKILWRLGQEDRARKIFEVVGNDARNPELADRARSNIDVLAHLTPGYKAPHFKASTLDGRSISSADFNGSVVVIHFWSSW